MTVTPTHKPRGPQVPLAPLKDWCHEQIRVLSLRFGPADDGFGPCTELAGRLGVNVRILNRIMRGFYCGSQNGHKGEFPTDVIGRNYVEDMLARAGVDFYELYPEFLYERDIELEADAWCRCCREFVTPIFGCCPWDDTPIHMERAA